MSIAISLHILFATIWVGGMFFAYMFLRPVVTEVLEPPQRLTVWTQVFSKFFNWVWAAVLMLIVSGHYMIMTFGGFAQIGHHIHLMMVLGYVMLGLFCYVFFIPFKSLKQAVVKQNWPTAAEQLNKIRKVIAINLSLGLITIIIAAAGRYF